MNQNDPDQHWWDWLEYSEESWRPEDSRCHLDSSERQSTNSGIKNSQEVKNKIIIIIIYLII